MQTVWSFKTGTISEIHLGKAGQESIITHGFADVDFCARAAEPVLKKGQGALVQALLHRCRRDRQPRIHLRYFRRQVRERGVGIPPDAEGDQGPFDKTGPTCGGFNVFGGKKFC